MHNAGSFSTDQRSSSMPFPLSGTCETKPKLQIQSCNGVSWPVVYLGSNIYQVKPEEGLGLIHYTIHMIVIMDSFIGR